MHLSRPGSLYYLITTTKNLLSVVSNRFPLNFSLVLGGHICVGHWLDQSVMLITFLVFASVVSLALLVFITWNWKSASRPSSVPGLDKVNDE